MPLQYVSRQAQDIGRTISGSGKTTVLFPAAFLAATGQGIMALGMVFYLREVYGATGTQVGAFFGLWYLCYILGCLVLRPMLSHVPPPRLLAASSFSLSILALAIHYGGSLAAAFLFYGLSGLSTALFWPTIEGWLSHGLAGAGLSKTMSRFNISWSIGAIASPYLGGWLSQKATMLPIFAASAVALLTSLLMVGAALALPSVRDDQSHAQPKPKTEPDDGASLRLRYSAWVGLFAGYVAVGVIMNIFPLSAREDLHFSKSMIGALLLIQALFCTVGFGVLGHTHFWHHRSSPMLVGQVGVAVCLAAMACVRHPVWLGTVLVFVGLLTALNYSTSMFHSMEGAHDRAARGAIHESVMSAGAIAGALLGGVIYQHFSIARVYALCAVLLLASAFTQAGIAFCLPRIGGRRS